MKLLSILTALLCTAPAALHAADNFLVENGQPRAEIVISDKPQRTTRLAAQELQDGIQKISAARLPIVTQPTSGAVHVFVGQSEYTERLKLTAEGLQHGAYRMTTGDDWLALIGADGMEAAILCAGPAEAVAVKASEGVGAAALEWAAENVCAHDESFLGCRLCASAKTGE